MKGLGYLSILLSVCYSAVASGGMFSPSNSNARFGKTTIILGSSESKLLRVNQSRADFFVSVSNEQDTKTNFNFGYNYGIDELVLLTPDLCRICRIEILPRYEIDRHSEIEFTVAQIKNPTQIDGLKKFREASMHFYDASFLKNFEESKVKYLLSLNLLEQASKLLELSPENDSFMLSLIRLADITSRFEAAKEKKILERVLKGDHPELKRYRAIALYKLAVKEGNLEKERQRIERGIRLSKLIEDSNLVEIGRNLLGINFLKAGKLDKAANAWQQAYEFQLGENRWREAFNPLKNLGFVKQLRNQPHEALRMAVTHQEYAKRFNYLPEVCWALYRIGQAYHQLGERFLANDFFDRSLALMGKLTMEEQHDLSYLKAFIHHDKAFYAYQNAEYDSAIIDAKKELSVFESLGVDSGVADANILISNIYRESGELDKARYAIESSIKYDLENQRQRSLGSRFYDLALLELGQSKFVESSKHLVRAFDSHKGLSDYHSVGKSLSLSVELLYKMDDPKSALEIANTAEPLIQKYGNERVRVEFYFRKAKALKMIGATEISYQELSKSLTLIKQTLPKIKRVDRRRRFISLRKSILDFSVDTLLESEIEDKEWLALNLIEAFRPKKNTEISRELVGRKFLNRKDLFDDRKRLIAELVNEVEIELSMQASAAVDAFNHAAVNNLSIKLSEVEAKITAAYEQTYSGNVGAQTQSLKKPLKRNNSDAIAYFYVGEQKAHLLFITQDRVFHKELEGGHVLKFKVDQFLSLFKQPPSLRENLSLANYNTRATDLSNALFGDERIVSVLKESKKLIVIPDAYLDAVPFDLLQLIDNSPLISQLSIEYALSLKHSQGQEAIDANSILVIENPAANFASPFDVLEGTDLPAHIFNGYDIKRLTGKRIDKTTVAKNLSEGINILHIDTHGVISKDNPFHSGLFLGSSNGKNAFWVNEEIKRSNFKLQLVVLAACESAIGKPVFGEGMMSLANAFLESGAQNTMGTLWPIDDKASTLFMNLFYEELLTKKTHPSSALRRAKLRMIKNKKNGWNDPYYWAAFKVMKRHA